MRVFLSALAGTALSISASASPSFAQSCDDLWYLRNLIAHRAGYCFASTLGRALFDTTACTSTSLQLAPDDLARALAIRQLETEFGCRVNTAASSLPDLTLLAWEVIETLPVPTGFESGCIGYQRESFQLRAAPDPAAPVVGQVVPGNSIGFNYEIEADWTFLITDADEGYFGWAPLTVLPLESDEGACEAWAG